MTTRPKNGSFSAILRCRPCKASALPRPPPRLAKKSLVLGHIAIFQTSPNMYLRDCALGKEIIVINGVNELLPELRRIGNNLNQLTRIANSGYTEVVDLSSVRKELSKIWQSLNSFLQDAR